MVCDVVGWRVVVVLSAASSSRTRSDAAARHRSPGHRCCERALRGREAGGALDSCAHAASQT
eukprot:1004557-Prymnesium_polylepis.2